MQTQPEVWLRGPVPGIPPLLQPVAHALLQATEELSGVLSDFPDNLLWEKPGGVASVGFHLRHLTGVLDRLFTYAREEALTEPQLEYLKKESVQSKDASVAILLSAFEEQVAQSLRYLETVPEGKLSAVRAVGRQRLPSTLLGLLFHAAEHTQRHAGQLLVTARILLAAHKA